MNALKSTVITIALICQGNSVLADFSRIEALVVDAVSGKPLEGVKVCGSFEVKDNSWNYVKGGASPNLDFGETDAQGRCKLSGKTNSGKVACFLDAGPSNYYWIHRSGGYQFSSKNLFGVWQPDDVVVTIKLQRVEHPIPLFVKKVKLDVGTEIANLNGGKFAYDMMTGDWLPPFGKGKIADVEFTRLPHEDLGVAEGNGIRGRAFRDSLSVKFSGKDNGLVEMHAPLAQIPRIRAAPDVGYRSDYLRWEGRNKRLTWDSNLDQNKCFCFRIRSRRDERGEIVEAYYGKVYGDFELYKGYNYIVCGARFFYYLNPTSLDRNLEWDRKTNLCPNPGNVDQAIGDRRP